MNRLVLLVFALSIVGWWYIGTFNNVFSEYQRTPIRYAAYINSAEDYTDFCDKVTKLTKDNEYYFAGGMTCPGFVEVVLVKKKTNMLCFWE